MGQASWPVVFVSIRALRGAALGRCGPQQNPLYEDLSATENLAYWGAAEGMRQPALGERMREVVAWEFLPGPKLTSLATESE